MSGLGVGGEVLILVEIGRVMLEEDRIGIIFILVRIRVFLLVFNLFINWLFNKNYFEIFMKYIVFLVIFYRV